MGLGDSGDKQEALTLLGPFLAGRCCHRQCHDPTQHTSGEKKQTFGGTERQLEKKQLWPYSKWMTREILSAPKKEFVLLSFMPIKLLSGGVLVYGAMAIWPTCLARYCSERQRGSPEDLSFCLSCEAEGSQGHSVENNTT